MPARYSHRSSVHSVFSVLSVFVVLLLSACESEEHLRTFCTSNADCPAGFRCNTSTGLCLCASDAVCEPEEYCAPDGLCRRRMSCETNLDCPDDTYCDTTTGNCIELGKCTHDKHCPVGRICSDFFTCVPGCNTTGDCALGQVCRDAKCITGVCEDKSFCDWGELCDPETETCFDAYDDQTTPYCRSCVPAGIGQPFSCGDGPNFCIMTGNDPSLEPFCGVDCSQGQECPNGYSCSLILRAAGGSCSADEQCSSGQCHINEGDTVGFCLCVSDNECPQDTCDDFTFRCTVTRRACTPGGGQCDRPIYCIEGLCLIGRNCTPIEGLRCADIAE
jgi:hypothetical protein